MLEMCISKCAQNWHTLTFVRKHVCSTYSNDYKQYVCMCRCATECSLPKSVSLCLHAKGTLSSPSLGLVPLNRPLPEKKKIFRWLQGSTRYNFIFHLHFTWSLVLKITMTMALRPAEPPDTSHREDCSLRRDGSRGPLGVRELLTCAAMECHGMCGENHCQWWVMIVIS